MHSFLSKVIVIAASGIAAIAPATSLQAFDSPKITTNRAWRLLGHITCDTSEAVAALARSLATITIGMSCYTRAIPASFETANDLGYLIELFSNVHRDG